MLSLDALRAALDALRNQRIHEHFPAYLHLRQRAILTRSFASIEPDWNEVSDLLRVPGGPPNKPHYRPFASRNVRDQRAYWLNPNLAGSYAPKSIRTTARFMLSAAGDDYSLPRDHAHQALSVLLLSTRVPAWALAAYYLRNYGFAFTDDGGPDELVSAFRREFLFPIAAGSLSESESDAAFFADLGLDTDFDVLFDNETRPELTGPWFEPLDIAKAGSDA